LYPQPADGIPLAGWLISHCSARCRDALASHASWTISCSSAKDVGHPSRGVRACAARTRIVSADEICETRTTTWTGDDCNEGGRTPPGGGQSRLAGDHPAGSRGGRTHRIGLGMVVGAADAPTVPIALGGAGGPVIDAPEAFGIVYDPIETLAYVAAETSRITLDTSVLDAPFQKAQSSLRRLATLDRFSDGRLVVGVGQGWMEQEFERARTG
jgi:hypothetical protein